MELKKRAGETAIRVRRKRTRIFFPMVGRLHVWDEAMKGLTRFYFTLAKSTNSQWPTRICNSQNQFSFSTPLGLKLNQPGSRRKALSPEPLPILRRFLLFVHNKMALTNFILTVAGVTAAVVFLRFDVKQSATIFRRNVRQIRHWLEEESATAAKSAERKTPKELESQVPKKDASKEDKN